MSCISTNLSDSQEDTLCSSPPCVCSLAHFPLYCFMTRYRISNASVHLCLFGCVQMNVFLSHTPPLPQNWIQVRPQSVPFLLFCQLHLSFSCFLSPLFLTAIIFALSVCFSFSFLGSSRGQNMEIENDKDTETE